MPSVGVAGEPKIQIFTEAWERLQALRGMLAAQPSGCMPVIL